MLFFFVATVLVILLTLSGFTEGVLFAIVFMITADLGISDATNILGRCGVTLFDVMGGRGVGKGTIVGWSSMLVCAEMRLTPKMMR